MPPLAMEGNCYTVSRDAAPTAALTLPMTRVTGEYLSEEAVDAFENMFCVPATGAAALPLPPPTRSLPDHSAGSESPFNSSESTVSSASSDGTDADTGAFEFEFDGDVYLTNPPLVTGEETDAESVDTDIVRYWSGLDLY